jgi:hypothetical protein
LIASVAADEPNGSTIAKDPCALALVPHEGTDKEDLEIIRLQTKVRIASHPTTWPEQLGLKSWRRRSRQIVFAYGSKDLGTTQQ